MGTPVATTHTATVSSAVAAQERTWATNCCGCCCDMRTAVIWVNVVSLILTAPVAMLFILAEVEMNSGIDLTGANSTFYQDNNDDQLRNQTIEAMAQIEDSSNSVIVTAISFVVIRMLCSAIGIYGAVKYKAWPVMVSLVVYILEFIVNIIISHFVGLIMPAFFVYPHFFFLRELKRNIHGHAAELPGVEMAEAGHTVEPLTDQGRIV